MVSVVVVNVVTIAADLQAGAAGLGLLTGVEPGWLVVPLGLVPGSLLLAGKYHHVAGVLRYLLIGFPAFGAVAVLAHPKWPMVLRAAWSRRCRSAVTTCPAAWRCSARP
jgi:Mn2+/Fe2+ NRAMP family transporter